MRTGRGLCLALLEPQFPQGAWTAPAPTPHWDQRGKLRPREGKDAASSTLGSSAELRAPSQSLPLPAAIHPSTSAPRHHWPSADTPCSVEATSWSVTQTAPATPSSAGNGPVSRQGQLRARPRVPRSK